MLPVEELIEPLTKEQVEATILALLTALGVSVTSWNKKGTARNIIGASATVIAALTVLVAAAIRGTILELAEGIWLTILAFYVYGVTRITATFAEGAITLTNTGGGIYELDPGELVVLNTDTDKSYTNIARVELGEFETLEGVQVRAREIGSASTATPGQIDAFVTPLLGVAVTNPSALVGTDEQLDVELRADCAAARGALSPFGAKGAYEYFAKRIKGGTPLLNANGDAIGVNRVQVVRQNLGAALTVYIATASGDVAGDVDTPGDDLYIVDQNIKLRAVPWGITETTANTNAVEWEVLYDVVADAAGGDSASAIKNKIDAALTAFYASYPIGGVSVNGTDYYLFRSKAQGIISAAHPAIITATVGLPLADLEMSPGDRAELTIAAESAVTLVSQ